MMNSYVKLALIVAGIAVVLVAVSKWNHWRKGVLPPKTAKKMRTLLKQAAHYGSLAEQDQNPVYSLLHANTALNYLSVAKVMVSDSELKKLSGIDIEQMNAYLLWQQEYSLSKLSNQCPSGKPADRLFPVSISK